MQSDASGPNQGDVPACEQPVAPSTPSNKKSIWRKTKETLGEVSTHASKVAALGTAGAAKTAEIGKQTLSVASEATRGALETGKQAYAGSKLESAVNYIDGELDQRGAKKAIKDTTGAVVGKLDQVTGKRLVELLEAKLRVQDEYNDILATRLAEAIDRIAKLETRFNDH
jgi:hypothetical protein